MAKEEPHQLRSRAAAITLWAAKKKTVCLVKSPLVPGTIVLDHSDYLCARFCAVL